MKCASLFTIVAAATLISEASGISTGGLRGASTSSTGQLTVGGGEDAVPPSCHIFDEMLGRVYFMRDQMSRTTASLGSLGYKIGEEWTMDQGIGNVTPDTLPNIVCSLLANTTKSDISLLAQPAEEAEAPTEEDAPPAKPTDAPTLRERMGNMVPEAPEMPEMGMPEVGMPRVPGWMGGGDAPEEESAEKKPATAEGAEGASKQPAEGTEGVAPPAVGNATANETAAEHPVVAPATPMEAGCPAGSKQKVMLNKLREGFHAAGNDGKNLEAVEASFADLVVSIEHGVMALYKYRGCPKVEAAEFKTRHVCSVHREEQSAALKMQQDDIPQKSARLFALQARLKDIDSGTSRECYLTRTTTHEPQQQQTAHHIASHEWCRQIHAVSDALLDGRPAQKQWLKDMGDGMQALGTMSMQLNKYITDPSLKKDKIPMNALKALTLSWKALESPTQQLRLMGGARSKQASEIDGMILQVSGMLKNVSAAEDCTFEQFRMRYGANTCASLKVELERAVEARRTDVKLLEARAQELFLKSSSGLIENKCTAPPMTQGCWLRLPSGCPKVPNWKSSDKWTRDVFGEQSTGAGTSQSVCMMSRKIQIDSMCGTNNAELRFVPA